jgi:hypothetical protein
MRRLGLTKKEWERMNTDRFYGLLDQLPGAVRETVDESMTMASPTITDIRRIAQRREVPEHVVLAIYGYLPSAYGDHYVSVDYGPHGERVQIRDQAHFVAYQLHREACFENRGPNPKVEVLPEARPQ